MEMLWCLHFVYYISNLLLCCYPASSAALFIINIHPSIFLHLSNISLKCNCIHYIWLNSVRIDVIKYVKYFWKEKQVLIRRVSTCGSHIVPLISLYVWVHFSFWTKTLQLFVFVDVYTNANEVVLPCCALLIKCSPLLNPSLHP